MADEKRFACGGVGDFWWFGLFAGGDSGGSLVWWFTVGSGARGYSHWNAADSI
ncbi:hypothetical protein [Companilactobacillus zhongbaensis]|uniref:hypothetical protein n=1 Tax=Companilactobacillus zhongbaensis TaxID=2486009 RepID=UPI0013DDBFA7|nr:hypothetical protein [Companilactobacillus zhongbaensis]